MATAKKKLKSTKIVKNAKKTAVRPLKKMNVKARESEEAALPFVGPHLN